MNKLGGKILRIVGLISLVSMLVLVLSNFLVFKFLFSKLEVEAQNVASESVSSIDGDKLEKIINEASADEEENKKIMESTEYAEIQHSMVMFKNDKDIKYLYTFAKKDNKVYIVVDSALVEPSPLGEEYDLDSFMTEAFNGKVSEASAAEPDPYGYGTLISAYAPVKNSAGEVIAITGADKDVSSFVYVRSFLLMLDMIVAGIVLLLAVIASLLFSRKITRNVRKVTSVLNKMSNGDLTTAIEVHSKDEIQEIAEYINKVRASTAETLKVTRNLSETVAKQTENLSAVSEEMSAASQEVAATIQEVAGGTNLQSDEMKKINSILEKFGEHISNTVNAVQSVNTRVEAISSKTQLSHKDLKILEDTIKDITTSFSVVREEIRGLVACLQQISEVTDLINAISGQTNLLALNAAIEANRAGESGRGFAVVAGEIRKLAEQSKVSVANISKLLENVASKSELVVKTSDVMEVKLSEQVVIVNNSINSFTEIIGNVEGIIPEIIGVANNINKIDTEKKNIIESVEATAAVATEVSASTQEIAASSEELSASSQDVASAAQDLTGASQDMMEMITRFKI